MPSSIKNKAVTVTVVAMSSTDPDQPGTRRTNATTLNPSFSADVNSAGVARGSMDSRGSVTRPGVVTLDAAGEFCARATSQSSMVAFGNPVLPQTSLQQTSVSLRGAGTPKRSVVDYEA